MTTTRVVIAVLVLTLGPSMVEAQRLAPRFYALSARDGHARPDPLHYVGSRAQSTPRASATPFILTGAVVGGIAAALAVGPRVREAEMLPDPLPYGLPALGGALLGAAMGMTVHRVLHPGETPSLSPPP